MNCPHGREGFCPHCHPITNVAESAFRINVPSGDPPMTDAPAAAPREWPNRIVLHSATEQRCYIKDKAERLRLCKGKGAHLIYIPLTDADRAVEVLQATLDWTEFDQGEWGLCPERARFEKVVRDTFQKYTHAGRKWLCDEILRRLKEEK